MIRLNGNKPTTEQQENVNYGKVIWCNIMLPFETMSKRNTDDTEKY